MKKIILTLGTIGLTVSTVWSVPQVLNFQGRLLESGSPVTGSRSMTFRIFNTQSAGAPLFSESRTVAVSAGIFNVLIGETVTGGIPINVFDGADKFVEVQVGSLVLPRQRIVSVGYAFRSDSAAVADKANSLSLGATIQMTIVNATTMTATNVNASILSTTKAIVLGDLRVGTGDDGVFTSGANNLITFTQPLGSPTPLIRTASAGQQGNLAPTGNTALNFNAGLTGVLNLNPASTGGIFIGNGATGATGITLNSGLGPISLNGNTGIGTTSPATKLHISSGTLLIDGNASIPLQVGLNTFVVNSDGHASINYQGGPQTFALGGARVFGLNAFGGPGGSTSGDIELYDFDPGNSKAGLRFAQSRGSPGAPAAVGKNDFIGALSANAFDGSAYASGMGRPDIDFVATENWNTTGHGSKIIMRTVQNGTLIRNMNALVIDQTGNVGIGVGHPVVGLDVEGSVQFGVGAAKSTFSVLGDLTFANNAGLMLSGPTGNIATASSVTASAFFGNGAGLTNISATDPTKVAKAGDTMTGQLTLSGSTLTVTGQNAAGFSLSLSSGLNMPAGTVNAGAFVGNGAGLTNITATDPSKVAKAGDTMTGQLTLSGSTLTVTGQNTGGFSLSLSSGLNMPVGTVNAGLFVGNGAGLFGVSASPGGANGQVQFNNAGTMSGAANIFYSTGSGNVGIGTTSPTRTLAVNGQILAGTESSGLLLLPNILQAQGSGDLLLRTDFGRAILQDMTGGINALYVTGGRVGIGTTMPAGRLDINGVADTAGSIGLQLRSANSSAGFLSNQISFGYANPLNRDFPFYSSAIKTRFNSGAISGNAFDFYTWQPGDSATGVGSLFNMTINGGNVGIGTTAPTVKLHIAGGNAAVTTQGNGLVLRATDGPNCYLLTVNNAGTINTTLVACP